MSSFGILKQQEARNAKGLVKPVFVQTRLNHMGSVEVVFSVPGDTDYIVMDEHVLIEALTEAGVLR